MSSRSDSCLLAGLALLSASLATVRLTRGFALAPLYGTIRSLHVLHPVLLGMPPDSNLHIGPSQDACPWPDMAAHGLGTFLPLLRLVTLFPRK
jgi:hypothetical protein